MIHIKYSSTFLTYCQITVEMVTKVQNFGPPPACQFEEIKEVPLQWTKTISG